MTDQERLFFQLPDGRLLPLPFRHNNREFGLKGNFREFPAGGFLAFFDDDTRTGAMYYPAQQIWQLVQPYTREQFWHHCEWLVSLKPATDLLEGLAGALREGNKGACH